MSEPDDRAPPPPEPDARARKERVLHTRVPAVLEQELKRLAESLKIPVSNVVRTILEDALDAVDVAGQRAEGEIRSVAERLAAERRRLREPFARAEGEPHEHDAPSAPAGAAAEPSPIAGAVGFTPMMLANDAVCAVTGARLRAGEQAYLVLFAEAGRTAIVGPDVPPHTPRGT